MKVLDVEEMENDKCFTRRYTFDGNVQVDDLLAIAKQFENSDTELSVCHCNTFDSDGNQLYLRYKQIDDIAQIKTAPSPYVSFSMDYCDKYTMDYKFSLITSINSDTLTYMIDKKKLPQQVINQQQGKTM